jgi:N-acyl-D-aspartate/D-glutamate deacylase
LWNFRATDIRAGLSTRDGKAASKVLAGTALRALMRGVAKRRAAVRS